MSVIFGRYDVGRSSASILTLSSVQEMGYRAYGGGCLYIRVSREDGKPMSWREVWEVFADRYPDQWAVQFFPPVQHLVDAANIYHLFVLQDDPQGVNINKAAFYMEGVR